MTTALCLNCGAMKFGAFCPCNKCGAATSGNKDIDLVFTDHFFTLDFLHILGEDFKEFNKVKADKQVSLKAFVMHASEYCPEKFPLNCKSVQDNMYVLEFMQKLRPEKRDIRGIEIFAPHHAQRKHSKGLALLILLTLFCCLGFICYLLYMLYPVIG